MLPSVSLNGLNPAAFRIRFNSASTKTRFIIFPASLAIMKPTRTVISATAILVNMLYAMLIIPMFLFSALSVIKLFIPGIQKIHHGR